MDDVGMNARGESRWVRASTVVARRVAGEMVLVPLAGPAALDTRFYVLNETAEWLWRQLDQPRSADELARHLTSDFDVDPARARLDVDAFLADLREQGAILLAPIDS